MRLVRVKTPEGKGADVARVAVEAGISEASVYQVQVHGGEGGRNRAMGPCHRRGEDQAGVVTTRASLRSSE